VGNFNAFTHTRSEAQLHKAFRFNSQSGAEAYKKVKPQPAATRRRAQNGQAVDFLRLTGGTEGSGKKDTVACRDD
jgi:hypothetical protein